MKKMCLAMMLALVIGLSAQAALFSDDFQSGNLNQWTPTNASIQTRSGSDNCAQIVPTGWMNTVADFTVPHMYQLDFDMYHYMQWNNDGRLSIGMPGGLGVGINGWNNGYWIWYQGTTIGQYGWDVGNTVAQWRHYTMVQDGLSAKFYKDGVLLNDITLPSQPDFVNYSKIGMYIGADWSGANAQFDNIVLTPEPATMALVGLGGLGFLRRK